MGAARHEKRREECLKRASDLFSSLIIKIADDDYKGIGNVLSIITHKVTASNR